MKSDWMDAEDVAVEFRFKNKAGEPDARLAREYLERERVQVFKLGRGNRYRRTDVEATMRVVATQRRSVHA